MTVKTAAEGGFEVGREELDWSDMDRATAAEFETMFEMDDRITVDPRALERRFATEGCKSAFAARPGRTRCRSMKGGGNQ